MDNLNTQPWQTPKTAPADGTKVRVWIDECDGFEHPEQHYVCRKYSNGLAGFKTVLGDRCTSVSLWRLDVGVEAPTPELVAQSHAEFKEWDDAN